MKIKIILILLCLIILCPTLKPVKANLLKDIWNAAVNDKGIDYDSEGNPQKQFGIDSPLSASQERWAVALMIVSSILVFGGRSFKPVMLGILLALLGLWLFP